MPGILNCEKEEEFQYCVDGFDPLPVVFHDMSKVRSLNTAYWHYDFGDSEYYGCSSVSSVADMESMYGGFRLPGDVEMLASSMHGFKSIAETFSSNEIPCLMSFGLKSYHRNNEDGKRHYTGMMFSADFPTSGSGCEYSVGFLDCPSGWCSAYRILSYPGNERDGFVGVSGIFGKISKDTCNRVDCGNEPDWGNDILHVYKGPGVYLATMQCSSESRLKSMDVSESSFSAAPDEHVHTCLVNVRPVCPYTSGFEVYGPGADKTKFATISSDYTIDLSSVGESSGFVASANGFVSGYAPYLVVRASGYVVPRSLPVASAWIDWSDWTMQYKEDDVTDFGGVTGGWPNWETTKSHVVSGEHVFTMPGVYSIGVCPIYDNDRISMYMPTVVDYDNCVETSLESCGSACKVVVYEIPPTHQSISVEETAAGESFPSVVSSIHMDVSAGSFPIGRIDWDFGDGTDIVSVSRDGYCSFVPGMSDVKLSALDNDTTVSFHKDGGSVSGYFTETEAYSAFDPRKVWFHHIYVRTNRDDHPDGYTIRASAFAENTNTMVTATTAVLTGGAGLPSFSAVEGAVEVSDVLDPGDGSMQVVMNSLNGNRTYVSNLIWE